VAEYERPRTEERMMTETPKTVLIVEDSPVQAASIGELLADHGLEVLYAPDGEACLLMAQRYLPDLIILDLEMPRMNGLDACRYLKASARTADIPVVMLTQYADKAGLVIEGIDCGAIDFIPKDTFADTVLLETLRQLHIIDDEQQSA
jgi:CheY-like chemotaxis protein